jgi:hypothetical protein
METLSLDNSEYKAYSNPMQIRFIMRDGEKVLQYSRSFVQYKGGIPVSAGTDWEDVKLEDCE